MKILSIHNRYKQAGGEDFVFQSEGDLLLRHGHNVEKMIYDNSIIQSFFDKCMSGLRSIYNPETARALRIRIQNFKPDVIHVHNFLPLVSPSVLIVAKKMGVPVILTLHNYRLICPSATLFHNGQIYEKSIRSVFPLDAIWKGVYRNSRIQTAVVALMIAFHHIIGTWKNKVDCYILLTHFAKEKLANSKLSIPANKMIVKPNFVEDCSAGVPVREDFFLFVGRLTEEKGVRTLLKAASSFPFKLIIIGDGPLTELVKASAQRNPNICYLGFQDKLAVMNYLKKCKSLIFPSVWFEGFPITILEAFSTGTPVLASDLGSMKEIIVDGVNGLHFEAGNESDLISKILRISNDKELAKKLSDSARACYLENYTPSKNYAQLTEIYHHVLGRTVQEETHQKSLAENLSQQNTVQSMSNEQAHYSRQ